jgi:molybdate transport system substrate-binding protein
MMAELLKGAEAAKLQATEVIRLSRNPSVYYLQSFLLCAALIVAGGCGQNANAPNDAAPAGVEIIVSAAASLRDAFQEIGRLYEARTGERISFNFGASGALQRQIEAGAPVDVFASAGAQQMDALADKNLIDRDTRRDFARNELVVVTPQTSAPQINSFPDLDLAAVRRIAIGNPRTVPAGQYAGQVFDRLGLAAKLQPKLILAEDVRQVLDYVARSEVDAGVVYRTDAQVAGSSVRIAAVAPESSHEEILYPIAVIRESRNSDAARSFVELVAGAEGQSILRRYGFGEAGAR